MKHYLILFFACTLVLVGITACDIYEYNPSGLTAETVYTTPEGFESLVSAAYSYQRWWYGKEEGFSASEMGSDLWTGRDAEQNALNRYQNLQSDVGALNDFWTRLYAAVNVCNAGIGRVGESGLSSDLQTIREAELRFLRAHYYWLIVETWGGVHLTTEETTGIEVTANRSSVDDFYNQIFTDLEFAIANLPESTSDYGRATKPSAEAFAARMHLTRGNDQEAYDLATNVINSYNFALLENYADLWEMENNVNEEIVYAVHYSDDPTHNDASSSVYPQGHGRGSNVSHLFFIMTYDQEPGMDRDIENGRPFNRFKPTRFLLDLYDEEIDSRYHASFKEVFYANTPTEEGLAPGDTAIYVTKQELSENFRQGKIYRIWDRNDIYNPDGTSINPNRYPHLRKFLDPTRDSVNLQESWRDAFVIRLAEMYLIAAEAQHNLGNNSTANGAAYYINVLRQRAAYPGSEAEMLISEIDVDIDFILDERGRELAGEQLRWFDLKRTDKLEERINQYSPLVAQFFQPHHVLRPIPQSFLDSIENPEEFGGQNPGYN